MNFLSADTLKILICLLCQKAEFIEIAPLNITTSFYDELNMLFSDKSEDVIKCSKNKENIIIKVKNKKQLEKFLQDYINNYKKGDINLFDKNFISYLSYKDNLHYVIEILKKESKRRKEFTFILNSEDLNLSPKDDKHSRFWEFILEIILDNYFKNYIEITNCNMTSHRSLFGKALEFNIRIVKTIDETYKALNRAYAICIKTPNLNLTEKEKEVKGKRVIRLLEIIDAEAENRRSKF